MKRKPIRVNWDDLEAAFDNPSQELVYYLDLVEGHVFLEGEGEESDFAGEDAELDLVGAAEPAERGHDPTRLYVERVTDEIKIDWIQRFVDEAEDLPEDFVARLREDLDSEDPASRIKETMREMPEGKDRWYLYRSERLHDLIEEWIDEHDIVVTEPPPWR